MGEEKQKSEAARKDAEKLKSQAREQQSLQQLQKVTEGTTQMEYIRNVFRRFLEGLPPGSSELESLVPVLATFFQFSSEELRVVQSKRQASVRTGVSSLFGWRG